MNNELPSCFKHKGGIFIPEHLGRMPPSTLEKDANEKSVVGTYFFEKVLPYRHDSSRHVLNTQSRLQTPAIHKSCRTICTQCEHSTTHAIDV